MENNINKKELVASLSSSTGYDIEECGKFLEGMFSLIGDLVKDRKQVKINKFGTFRLQKSGLNKKVNEILFLPSKELAEIVNEPFEAFSSVELNNGDIEEGLGADKDDELKEVDDETEIDNALSHESAISNRSFEQQSDEELADDEFTAELYNYEKVYEGNTIKLKEESIASNGFDREITTPGRKFGWGFIYGVSCTLLICLALFVIGFYNGWWNNVRIGRAYEEIMANIPSENVPAGKERLDSAVRIEEKEIKQSKEEPVVYDTVSTTRYLTTIAREHYGNFNLWPYIYMENSSILGHPDRITPGTQVVVPSLSKYGVDASNKEDIEEAKKKAREIYSHYK